MKLELYTADQSRGFMVEWLLNECGATYTRHELDLFKGEHKSPDYLAVHPQGAVPALLVNGEPIIESLGICLFLADAFPDHALAPSVGTLERALYCQWMVYATATIEPTLSDAFIRSLGMPPSERANVATEEELEAMEKVLAPLNDGFKRGTLVHDQFSAADIVVGSELHWAHQVGLLQTSPDAVLYLSKLKERSAFPG